MKTISTFLFLIITLATTAQDHYAIAVKYDKSAVEIYPKNVVMTLIDPYGMETLIEGDETVDVTGNYTLKIEVPWSTAPEFIKSNGGNLQRFKIPKNYDWNQISSSTQNNSTTTQRQENTKIIHTGKKQTYAPKPVLERKEITYNESTNRKDLLAVFSNGLVYS